MRNIFWVLCAALLSGCASTAVDRLLPNLGNMSVAESYFGAPQRVVKQPDGLTVSEWLLDDIASVPGQYVTVRVYFRDRDGFPDYYEYTVWVPEHQERRYCRIRLTADAQGGISDFAGEGDHCAALLIRPSTY